MLMARSPAIFIGPGASAGNESTSVALFFPRNCRFSRRMAASVVRSTETCPRNFTAACASRRKRASVCRDGMRWPRKVAGWLAFPDLFGSFDCGERSVSRSGSKRIIVRGAAISAAPCLYYFTRTAELLRFRRMRTLLRRLLFRGRVHRLAEIQRQLLLLRLGRLVSTDDTLHQRMTHHIPVGKVAERDTLHPIENVDRIEQARLAWIRQIDLRNVARDHSFRVVPHARQEHLHLLDRGVLRLIHDDERIVESAPAHKRKRRNLNDILLEHLV